MPPLAGAPGRALLGDAGETAGGIGIALEAAPAVVDAAEAGVEEQPARHRRRPASTCMTRSGLVAPTLPASGDTRAGSVMPEVCPSQLRQVACSSQKPLILFVGVGLPRDAAAHVLPASGPRSRLLRPRT